MAYLEKRNGDKKENLKLAIQTFKSVLEIYIHDDYPQELAITLGNMGWAYLSAEDYTKAYEAFADSINIENFLRWEIIFGSSMESDKQNLAEEWNHHYQGILKACLNLTKDQPDYFADAIEYAERSKVRNLIELLNKKKLYPRENCYSSNQKLYQIHCRKLDSLRRKIFSRQWQKQSKERLRKFLQESNEQIKVIDTTIKRINTKLEKLRQEQDKLIQEIHKADSNFIIPQKLNEIGFSEIKDLIDENTAIIEWYITNDKIITFIIAHNKETKGKKQSLFLESSHENLELLIKWCKEYFEAYYAPRQKKLKEHKEDRKEDKEKKERSRQDLRQQWQSELTTRFQELAKILDIEKIVFHIENYNRLILVPHRFLHLLPLHALPLGEQQDKCLLDKFKGGVSYIPSCQLLQISQELQSKRTEFSKLFAVQNPNNDLPYAELEVDAICKFFSSSASEVLKKQDANEAALKVSENLPLSHCCHFACHGEFNLKSPVESALLLSEHKSSAKDQQLKEDGQLTLPEIFRLTLDQCRLVTLSACETGMVDPDSISDEYIGLPSGFMFAGSPSVVASLWKASDVSTIFLMSKFYQNLTEHIQKNSQLEEGAVAIALNQAQCWLRDATNTELMQKMENFSLKKTQKVELKRFLQSQEKPFNMPYYWAAFCAIGQ